MNVFNNRIKRSVVYSTSTISIYGVIGWTTSLCRWSILIFVWYVCVCVRQRPNKFLCRHIFFPPTSCPHHHQNRQIARTRSVLNPELYIDCY